MADFVTVDTLFTKLPSRRKLSQDLDQMALSADAKILLGQLLSTTARVADRVIEVGRHILAFVFEMVRRFPATTFGAVVGFTVASLIGSIPILGLILGPLLGPIMTAFLLTQGALSDMRNLSLEREVEALERKFSLVLRSA